MSHTVWIIHGFIDHSILLKLPYWELCKGVHSGYFGSFFPTYPHIPRALQRSVWSLEVAAARVAAGEPTIHLPGCECGVFALLQHHRGLEYPPSLGSCFHVLPLLSTISFYLAVYGTERPTTVPGLLASLSVWLAVDIWWCILIKKLQALAAGTNLSFNRLFSLCNPWGCFYY